MSQHARSAGDEGIQLIYSSLLPDKRFYTLPAALLNGGEPALGEPGLVRASRSTWPWAYHRVLTGTFLGALFALGVLLGTVVLGYVASLRSLPSSPPVTVRPGEMTTLATQ
jgi:hypothetical protein